MVEHLGIIGLGIMGRPMAHNLLKSGFPLTILNHRQTVTDELVASGATDGGALPCSIAANCDILILMLPDPQTVEHILTGQDGVLKGIRPGMIIIDMGTTGPELTRTLATQCAEKEVTLLDAPVSGGDRGAIDATLSIMVGGQKEAFERCQPIFQALGKTIVYTGGSGTGQTVKACNQIVIALTLEAISEALVLAEKSGVDPMQVVQVISGGLGASRLLELRGPSMVQHDFYPRGKIKTQVKDLGLVLDLARSCGTSLPVTALVDQMYASLLARGKGELDHSAILTYLEDLADIS